MRLDEIFSKTYDWEYKQKGPDDEIVASFTTDNDIIYEVEVVEYTLQAKGFMLSDKHSKIIGDNEVWYVEFTAFDKGDIAGAQDIMGSGDSIKVLSTVIEILKDITQKIPPNSYILFHAKEPSRKKLYSRLARKFMKGEVMIDRNKESNFDSGSLYFLGQV